MLSWATMSKEEDRAIGLAIGGEVKRLREEADWSQRELATRSHMPPTTIAGIEGGKVPTASNLFRLSAALDTTPNHFYNVAMGNGAAPRNG